MDIQTVKKEDLSFETDFVLHSDNNEYAHAFVLWFDIEFTHCHKPVYFGTGPQHRYTHWKQAVFYIEDVFAISAGEEVKGHFSCKVCSLLTTSSNVYCLVHVELMFEKNGL